MELEKRGRPAVLIAEEPFVRAGRAQARMLGIPDLPVISLGAHLTQLPRDGVRERVDGVIEAIAEGLRRQGAEPEVQSPASKVQSLRGRAQGSR